MGKRGKKKKSDDRALEDWTRGWEIFKASRFVFDSRPKRLSRSHLFILPLPPLSLSLSSGSIYRRHISSREISRAISATDFYAAIILRFSFLFSSSCASFYAHSHIRLLSSGSGSTLPMANPLGAFSLSLSVPLFTRWRDIVIRE